MTSLFYIHLLWPIVRMVRRITNKLGQEWITAITQSHEKQLYLKVLSTEEDKRQMVINPDCRILETTSYLSLLSKCLSRFCTFIFWVDSFQICFIVMYYYSFSYWNVIFFKLTQLEPTKDDLMKKMNLVKFETGFIYLSLNSVLLEHK